jgi:hypothetical protein
MSGDAWFVMGAFLMTSTAYRYCRYNLQDPRELEKYDVLTIRLGSFLLWLFTLTCFWLATQP